MLRPRLVWSTGYISPGALGYLIYLFFNWPCVFLRSVTHETDTCQHAVADRRRWVRRLTRSLSPILSTRDSKCSTGSPSSSRLRLPGLKAGSSMRILVRPRPPAPLPRTAPFCRSPMLRTCPAGLGAEVLCGDNSPGTNQEACPNR